MLLTAAAMLTPAASMAAPAGSPAAGIGAGGLDAALAAALARTESKVIAWRRDFHAHPEFGFAEHRTARLVAVAHADPLMRAFLDAARARRAAG